MGRHRKPIDECKSRCQVAVTHTTYEHNIYNSTKTLERNSLIRLCVLFAYDVVVSRFDNLDTDTQVKIKRYLNDIDEKGMSYNLDKHLFNLKSILEIEKIEE
jgi:hypothetical protein